MRRLYRSLELSLYEALSSLILCCLNSSLLGLLHSQFHLFTSKNCQAPLVCPFSGSLLNCGAHLIHFLSLRGQLSLFLMSVVFKNCCSIYFVQNFSCFRQEDKYSPCYFILPTCKNTNYSRSISIDMGGTRIGTGRVCPWQKDTPCRITTNKILIMMHSQSKITKHMRK